MFGVFNGKSIISASKINTNSKSIFIGFDTFIGLPENWVNGYDKGSFSANGNIPQVSDKRITFVKGIFQETLKPYLDKITQLVETRQLFINMDADLFSSTLYVLSILDVLIKNGTFIRFDEFGELTDNSEFLAFMAYLRAYQCDFEIILADKWHRHVIIRILKVN